MIEPTTVTLPRAQIPSPATTGPRSAPASRTSGSAHSTATRCGIDGGWPVLSEPFLQWVLQDSFTAGRRPEDVGVQLVPDVEPYELMKLRLLNGTHQAMSYLGCLASDRLVHEVAQGPIVARFLMDFMTLEASPTPAPVPRHRPRLLPGRAAGAIFQPWCSGHRCPDCAFTSDPIPTFLLPVVRERLAAGGDVTASGRGELGSIRRGLDEQGNTIEVIDKLEGQLTAAAIRQREEPDAFIQVRTVFGDLADNDRFTSTYPTALESLHTKGARATVDQINNIGGRFRQRCGSTQ